MDTLGTYSSRYYFSLTGELHTYRVQTTVQEYKKIHDKLKILETVKRKTSTAEVRLFITSKNEFSFIGYLFFPANCLCIQTRRCKTEISYKFECRCRWNVFENIF